MARDDQRQPQREVRDRERHNRPRMLQHTDGEPELVEHRPTDDTSCPAQIATNVLIRGRTRASEWGASEPLDPFSHDEADLVHVAV
jgi:hypothetical protein